MRHVCQRILVLAPHTDDGEFGCGGSIAKFLDEGHEVYYVAFSTATQSVPAGMPKDILKREVKQATQLLGIKTANLVVYDYEVRKLNFARQEILEELIKLKKRIKPELVLLPSVNDLHQDHQTIAMEGLRAFKQVTLLGYELPWNNITFHTQLFIKLSESYIQRKVKALEAYKSQKDRMYANEAFIRSWAKTRGTQIGTTFAETFEVIRWIIN